MKKNQIISIQPLITVVFCFILFFQQPVMAQNDNKGVLSNQLYDTRSLSLANTTIADVYGKSSIGINSALSGLFKNPAFIQLSTNHNWDNDLMQHSLTLPTLSAGLHHITARFGFLHKGSNDLPFTSSSPLTQPDILMYRGEIAYAFAISNHFSLGAVQSISYTTTSENEEAEYWNYSADIGLVYAPDGPVSYGLVFRGLGHEVTYEIIETGQTTLGSRVTTQILEVGATLRYPIEERTYLSISFANEKRFGQDGLWYKGGLEITPFQIINIRGGVMVNFDQSLFIPRMGLGINAGAFHIDYMVAPKNLIREQFHQIGLTIQF